MGRPAIFDNATFEEICLRIASGETLRGVCRSDERFPAASSIRRWVVLNEPAGVAERYARARESCIHEMIDETIEVSDDTSRDTITKTAKDGTEYDAPDNEWIQRSRLRVDTRKWIASKICPKLYGDRVQQEITGAEGGPLIVTWKKPE